MRSRIRHAAAIAAACMLVHGASSSVSAQSTAESRGVFAGAVLDSASAPVAGAEVLLVELARIAITDRGGRFRFQSVTAGRATLRVRRLGYAEEKRRVDLGARDPLVIRLRPTAIQLSSVNVVANRERGVGESFQPTTMLEGAALDRGLGGSVAATIAGEPGVTVRYNGPMAAQPVVRGLAGDRVLVLEDGLRTGDLATTAPDHAITIDPLAARRVEVIRGPAGLLHGTNTLGGVVNVVREDVPRARLERLTASGSTQFESVNRGATAALGVAFPAGERLAVRVDGTARTAGDTRTPGGTLPFTDLDGFEAGAGASWVGERGYFGGAARDYRSYYGVPSSYQGRTLPGAHEGGVYVDVRRTTGRLEGELLRPASTLRSVRILGSYVRYEHAEHERGGFVGTRFGQLAASGEAVARFGAGAHASAVGTFAQWRDLRAEGSYTGTRPARLTTVAAFAMHEVDLAPLRLMAGARWDRVRLKPLDSTETRLLRDVRSRAFDAPTGSLAATYDLTSWATLGASVARAFRPPAIEELYSLGPHLASYAYEVGNPALRAETGTGADAFVRVRRARMQAEVAVFGNVVDDYIAYAPQIDPETGLPLRDPRLRRYVVYRPEQRDALLTGTEGSLEWEMARGLAVEGVVSWVRGSWRPGDEPLPGMPPLQGRLAVRRDTPRWFAGLGADWRARQSRVPSRRADASCTPAQDSDAVDLVPADYCPTSGVGLLTATAGVRWTLRGQLHAVTLALDNTLDVEWRDHLWRAKQVAPQPGRNVRLLYRVAY